MSRLLLPAALTATALVLAACGSASSSSSDSAAAAASSAAAESSAPSSAGESSAPSGATVVVTTSILGDVVGQIVACGGGTTTVLMPNGTDPHDFTPSSSQLAELVSADLVVANGLGLEAGLTDALASAAEDGTAVLEVAAGLDPIPFGAGGHAHAEGEGEEHAEGEEHSEGEDHAHGDLDPHFWFDMTRMATAAGLVGDRLAELTGNPAYVDCAADVSASLTAAEAQVRSALESVPAESRILVTDHEALGYLADTYGYEIAGTVIPSGSTLAEPSSADLAALAETIRTEGVPVIFANVSQNSALAEAVAAEVGTDVSVVPLFVESLGDAGTQAATYEGMMLENARLISENLQP